MLQILFAEIAGQIARTMSPESGMADPQVLFAAMWARVAEAVGTARPADAATDATAPDAAQAGAPDLAPAPAGETVADDALADDAQMDEPLAGGAVVGEIIANDTAADDAVADETVTGDAMADAAAPADAVQAEPPESQTPPHDPAAPETVPTDGVVAAETMADIAVRPSPGGTRRYAHRPAIVLRHSNISPRRAALPAHPRRPARRLPVRRLCYAACAGPPRSQLRA